jgi:osmotically inducible protein OsmC
LGTPISLANVVKRKDTKKEELMANVERRAHVVWEGNLASGSGTLTEEDSGALREAPVTFASRTGSPEGQTSPEELIASAHATCYAMALSVTLAENDTPPEQLTVDAVCTLDDESLKITTMNLDVRGGTCGVRCPASTTRRSRTPPKRPSSYAQSPTL